MVYLFVESKHFWIIDLFGEFLGKVVQVTGVKVVPLSLHSERGELFARVCVCVTMKGRCVCTHKQTIN